ncbi:uncharacterized protein M421DRAFT_385367 [Didymella exigua CBS 183.55]|uniref:Uncharacterized protein n=1 Tax=Didymella exigua CBS 183.55 TaxID=1150837 RepID=A0A6A5RXZ4_9PLEO|nr:uncharacterized protein M421DRAFT_385367 [Didymella exigua CBS 183.55]KAF1930127.1 hypothetical protein M421DRAFT_385367 [Didymella exigua CBS 183.55]
MLTGQCKAADTLYIWGVFPVAWSPWNVMKGSLAETGALVVAKVLAGQDYGLRLVLSLSWMDSCKGSQVFASWLRKVNTMSERHPDDESRLSDDTRDEQVAGPTSRLVYPRFTMRLAPSPNAQIRSESAMSQNPSVSSRVLICRYRRSRHPTKVERLCTSSLICTGSGGKGPPQVAGGLRARCASVLERDCYLESTASELWRMAHQSYPASKRTACRPTSDRTST